METHLDSKDNFKSGYIAILGRTNVGKSTLINAILGQNIAAISPRPQTTRRRQLGIFTSDQVQIIFIDTPGLHQPKHKLGEHMVQEARDALSDCDLILFIVDISEMPHQEDQELAELILGADKSSDTIIIFNKIDLLQKEDQIQYHLEQYLKLIPETEYQLISAIKRDSIQGLLEKIIDRMPFGPQYYPAEQITDLYEREIAADLIRAAALVQLREEVPHGIAIRIDQFTERESGGAYIRATIFVDRDSHKGIVIGQKGLMLKSIGSAARQEIELMSGRKVFLELRVKVRKNWRNEEKDLKLFGFNVNDRSK